MCDDRLLGLPTARRIEIVGPDGSCLYRFAPEAKGFIYQDGQGGAVMSGLAEQDFDLNVPLRKLSRYEIGPDGKLARDEDGKLIEGTPPATPFLVVLEQKGVAGLECCDNLVWRMWRGKPGEEGFIRWDGEGFQIGPLYDAGLCTTTAIPTASQLRLVGIDPALDVAGAEKKCLMALELAHPDVLISIPADGAGNPAFTTGLNQLGDSGIIYYPPDGSRPVVLPLCGLGEDECGTKPVISQFLGCDENGKPTSSMETPAIPTGACGHVLADCGEGFAQSPIGLTFWPGWGTLLTISSFSGSTLGQILQAAIAAAVGFSVPRFAKYVSLRITTNVVSTGATGNSVSVAINGRPAGVSVCGANQGNSTQCSIIADLLSAKTLNYTIQHFNAAESTWSANIFIEGFYVCPCNTGTVCDPISDNETPPPPPELPEESPPGPG